MLVAFAATALNCNAQFWNDTGNPSVILGTNFLGSINPAPLDFRTANRFRARINEAVTYPSLNSFTNIPADGFTLITPDNGFLSQVKGPFSRLHLAEGGTTGNAEQWGYRPWQRNGITFTGNTDQGYMGQKYRDGDDGSTDMVIQWSDNPGQWKGDRMRFLFTSSYNSTATTGMNSREGLEGMRLYPDERDFINVGIGDFFAGGDDPTERLDVRTGRVRIRQLPTDAEANTLDQYMVVDNTGVVKWRHLPPIGGAGCEWELLSGKRVATAWRAAGSNGSCPDAKWRLGIGNSYPMYKVDIFHTEADTSVNGGLFMDLRTNSGGWRTGIGSTVQPMQGGTDLLFAISMSANLYNVGSSSSGVLADSYGMFGRSSTKKNLYLRYSQGVHGEARATTGSVHDFYGGFFMGLNQGGNVTNAYGVYGEANGGTTNYGVYGAALNGTTNWAGYFNGDLNTTGTGYFVNGTFVASDAQFKTNVQPLEDPMSVIMQLHPHRYDYLVEAYPQMHFPGGTQAGLLAQEVAAVLPALVRDTRVEAVMDTAGMELSPAVQYKAVNYAGLVPYLIGAFQQQQATITQMQAQLAACCAANPGMAPGGNGALKAAPATGEVKEQRLLIIPNPVADLTTLEYYVPQAGKVSLSITTSDGKPMGTLREEQAEAGAYTYQWNTTKLAAGTYFCTYLLDGAVVVKRAVKVK